MRRHVHLLLTYCEGCGFYRKDGPRCPVPFCRLGGPTKKDLAIQAKHNDRIFRRLMADKPAVDQQAHFDNRKIT
jgi:hypothetical protein